MKIEHIAIWCSDLEKIKTFYETFFDARANPKYTNPEKGYESYFLSFETGPRLELMTMASIPEAGIDPLQQALGITHLAFSVDSQGEVDRLTQSLQDSGYQVVSGPRRTGDGYYESLVLDPENNRIEITT
jgi:lactoylglutathione lyase